jgi:predicted nuclease with TOPRIM domain
MHDTTLDRKDIREAQQRVREQEALVRRLILNGVPTQAAEDRLRQLEKALSLLKQAR